jgi:hypothetical protein
MDVQADTRRTRPLNSVGQLLRTRSKAAPGILVVDDNGNANTLDLLH